MADSTVLGPTWKLLIVKLMEAGLFMGHTLPVVLTEPRGDTDNAQTQHPRMVGRIALDRLRKLHPVQLMVDGHYMEHTPPEVMMEPKQEQEHAQTQHL